MKPQYYKSYAHYYKLISENELLVVHDSRHFRIEMYGRGNIEGKDSVLTGKDLEEISEDEFKSACKKVLNKIIGLI